MNNDDSFDDNLDDDNKGGKKSFTKLVVLQVADHYQKPMMLMMKMMPILTKTIVKTNKSLTRLIGLSFVPREVTGTP